MHDWNQLGEPIGFALEGWTPPSWPPRDPMEGHFCRVEAGHRTQDLDLSALWSVRQPS